MGDVGVELVFLDEMIFECTSGAITTGAQGAAVIMGTFAERDVKLKVAAIRKGEGAAVATMDGAAESVFGDSVWGTWARSAVASWECQCDNEGWSDCEAFWDGDTVLSLCICAPFMLSKG